MTDGLGYGFSLRCMISTSQRIRMIFSGLKLFLAMGPPLAINFKNTNFTYGPFLGGVDYC